MAKDTKPDETKKKESKPERSAPAEVAGSEPWWNDLPSLWRPFGLMQRFSDQSMIKIEEFDDGGTHVVRAEVPGIDPDNDVSVTVDHGVLTVRAERRQQKKTEEKDGYRSEFSYGSFTRSVRLPAGATESDVSASYQDGILEVRFPIDQGEAKAKKIKIQRAGPA
jgi:HSP20 family protein